MPMRRLLAAAAALVMCFALVSCGDTDSGKDEKSSDSKTAASPWNGGNNDDDEKSKDEKESEAAKESEEEKESKAEPAESKAEPEESKPEPQASEPEPEVSEPEPEESKAEPEESKAEPEPDDGSVLTVKGKGYTVSFGEGWEDMSEYKDQIGKNTADKAKDALNVDISSFAGMDVVVMYKPAPNENAPVFNVVEPVKNAAFSAVKTEDMEQILLLSLQKQMSGKEGFKIESKGVKEYNGEKFIELYTEYDIGTVKANARQFFAIHNSAEYVISFSITDDKYDAMYDETEKVMKTFKFTEG